jgi:plastocyanin
MKKIYSLIILGCIVSVLNTQGTVWNVGVFSTYFSPDTLPDVVCGDTIFWTLGLGSHTTTSTTIPPGAPPWDAPIYSLSPTFQYVVPNIAGVYNYICVPHGYTASFTVSCSVGMNGNVSDVIHSIYPNPFFSKVTVSYHDADELRIADISGKPVKTIRLNSSETKTDINLDELDEGVYFCSSAKDGIIKETKRIVKSN